MKYVLIVLVLSYYGRNPAITSVEFNTLAACENAATTLKSSSWHNVAGSGRTVHTMCLPKGE